MTLAPRTYSAANLLAAPKWTCVAGEAPPSGQGHPMDHLGQRLKDVRLKAGMTLRELARQADVSPSLISQIENGKSQPSVATLYSFSRLLNVSVDELFDERDTTVSDG